MAKNILFFTALKANDPNMQAYKEWSIKTWTYYAKKYDLELFILEEPLMDTELMRPTWQRWYVYDLLDVNGIEYNQIAMIDIDTMVRWDTPNIFELAGDRYTGVIDDLSIEWVWNSIQGYKKFFPETDLNWYEYINNGILVLPISGGREFCDKVKAFYETNSNELRKMQHETLKKGTDQTPVNYMAKEMFGKPNLLPKPFNMCHLFATHALIENIYIKAGYIWHFNAIPREERNQWMQHTWNQIKDNYI